VNKRQEERATRYEANSLELLVNKQVVAVMALDADGGKKLADAFAAEFLANGYRGFATMAAAKKAVR
jgi:hypothetical protein